MRVSTIRLAELCGVSTRTVKKRCESLQTFKGDKNAIEYESTQALPLILKVGSASDGSYSDEKTRLTKSQADHEELKVAELKGELIRVDAAVLQWQNMVSAARAKLLSMGSKLAPIVSGLKKTAEIKEEIDQVVYEALGELSETGLSDEVAALLEEGGESVEAAAETDSKRVGRQRKKTQRKGKRRARKVANR